MLALSLLFDSVQLYQFLILSLFSDTSVSVSACFWFCLHGLPCLACHLILCVSFLKVPYCWLTRALSLSPHIHTCIYISPIVSFNWIYLYTRLLLTKAYSYHLLIFFSLFIWGWGSWTQGQTYAKCGVWYWTCSVLHHFDYSFPVVDLYSLLYFKVTLLSHSCFISFEFTLYVSLMMVICLSLLEGCPWVFFMRLVLWWLLLP